MRSTTLLALGAAILLAACADSPASSPTSPRSSDGSVATLIPSTGPSAHSKPVTGFSTITTVSGGLVNIAANTSVDASMACPAGTTVFGGTYNLISYSPTGGPPWVARNQSDSNGWLVTIDNSAVGAKQITIMVTAYCLS